MKQDVKISKYAFRFGVVNLALLIGIGFLLTLIEVESNAGVTIGALMGAAVATVSKFIKDNKRVPTVSEKIKLVWLSYLASWVVSIFLFGIFVAVNNQSVQFLELMKSINAAVLIGIIVFLSVLYLGALSMAYGYMARKQFEGLRKKGGI